MTSQEAHDRMIEVLTKAEDAADKGWQTKAELYIKIADQWNDIVWQAAEQEKTAQDAAKSA